MVHSQVFGQLASSMVTGQRLVTPLEVLVFRDRSRHPIF